MRASSCSPVAAAIVLALCCGCGKRAATAPEATNGPDALVAAADQVLGVVLSAELGSPVSAGGANADYPSAYRAYSQAFQSPQLSASGRSRARFGLAVTGLLMVTKEPEVKAALEEWKSFLQNRVPFQAGGAAHRPLGIPAGFARGTESLDMPFDVVPVSVVSLARSPLAANDPRIATTQAILRERVIPRLTEVISHLDAVAADPRFTFRVTPEMMGGSGAEPVEIDHTDVLALRAACKLLSATSRVVVAYRLDFPAYDEASLLAAVQPGSAWLTLADDGAGQMSLAGAELLGSIDDVMAAITALLAESDPQNDDVIRVGPDPKSQQALALIREHLPKVQESMRSGFVVSWDWDHNPATPAVPLTVRLSALFTHPIDDWKQMVPPYAASTEHRTLRGATVAIPVITWEAASYEAWQWPDPTFHGLLPDLSSTAQFLGVFGMTRDRWQRSVALDWTRFVSSAPIASAHGGPAEHPFAAKP